MLRVFLSHASVDKPIARRIKKTLEKHGLSVWLDEVEIRVGQSIPQMVTEGLVGSDGFCILLSQNAMRSGWVGRELNSIMSRVITGSAFLVPCRLDDVDIPILISDIKYADFRGSFSFGMQSVMNAINIREVAENAARQEKEAVEKELREIKIIKDISNSFNDLDLKWIVSRCFLHGDNVSFNYFNGDVRDTPGPWNLLSRLLEMRLIQCDYDRHERYYTSTVLGSNIFKRILLDFK